jgi:hypothetical protein
MKVEPGKDGHRSYSTWERAIAAQSITPSKLRKPAHGGYPGAMDHTRTTNQALGSDRAYCPDCRVDYTCPFHRIER